MKHKKTVLLSVFVLVVLAQLFVPTKMILDREDIIKTGKEYKFKTAPVDPNDPFRGKYITLRFDDNTFLVEDETEWDRQEDVYIEFMVNLNGFVRIKSVSKEEPEDTEDYLKAKVSYISDYKIHIDYPFDRYYMEESKAYEAEQVYNKSQREVSNLTYALVHIKNGGAVLTDVLIDGESIKDIVKKNQNFIKE